MASSTSEVGIGSMVVHGLVLMAGLATVAYGPSQAGTVGLIAVMVGAVGLVNISMLQSMLQMVEKVVPLGSAGGSTTQGAASAGSSQPPA